MRFAALALLMAAPALAQSPAASAANTAFASRLQLLVPILGGTGDYAAFFAPRFQQDVPEPRFAQITQQLRDLLGEPQAISAMTPDGPWGATLVIRYQRGTATVRIALDPAAPHLTTGLLITGTTLASDSLAKLTADFQALPGASGFGIYRLGEAAPQPVAEWRGDQPAPLGSAFKLWILAEAVRQVAAGERRWSDVVPLGAPSLASGILQTWPRATPLTLQSLATLMITISDNTAADTLLMALGRDRIDRMAERAGAAPGSLPVLTTREAFVLKGDPALTAQWQAAPLEERRQLLREQGARIAAAPLRPEMFRDTPVATDDVEWFASPAGMARALDQLRLHGDAVTRAILAVNAGTDPTTAGRFDYIGFNGGSEPGVVTLNYLVRAKDGSWLAVTGNWHRSDTDIATLTFSALMNRALALAAG